MLNNTKIHNRQSILLKGYDYSQNGLYFITICTQNQKCLFWDIFDKNSALNDAGLMIEKWYFELENKYINAKCHQYAVMPNHFHCIVEIKNLVTNGKQSIITTNQMDATKPKDAHVGTSLRGRPENDERARPENDTMGFNKYGFDNIKTHASLFGMMGWFKTMTTNEYIRGVKNDNWPPFEKRLWQLRYWDHIVRNENDFDRISKYIETNPAKWIDDKFFNC